MLYEINNLEKYYGNKNILTRAIDNFNLKIEESEYISIVGKSGSGKTTLLNLMSSIDKQADGEILYKKQNLLKLKEKDLIKFRQEELGFVFQDYQLIDSLNIYDNIALALTLIGKYNEKKINEICQLLDIEDVIMKYPNELSGGQKQRVSVARALVKEPTILFCDEPTGALDTNNAQILMNYLTKINNELKVTIVIVTHDLVVASKTKRIIFMKDGQNYSEITKIDGVTDEVFYQSALHTNKGNLQ